MSDVPPTPLNKDGITPELIAQHIVKDAGEMEEIYVIAFNRKKVSWSYYSGTARGMALASLIMQNDALRAIEQIR